MKLQKLSVIIVLTLSSLCLASYLAAQTENANPNSDLRRRIRRPHSAKPAPRLAKASGSRCTSLSGQATRNFRNLRPR
jgi:hypothetical protein